VICGDGITAGSEGCDDGNTDDGDCCDSTCQAEPIRVGCRTAQKSGLLIKNNATDSKDKLVWKWLKGAATTLAEFGNPAGTTAYSLCVYAGTTAVVSYTIDPSATFWSPAGTKGLKYKDTTGSSDGIQKAILKSGDAGKAKALVKGKGTNLPDPALPFAAFPVTAQLVNSSNNVCFDTVFNAPNVKKNDVDQFKAKTP
jgi:cysteine-rich repeat protein